MKTFKKKKYKNIKVLLQYFKPYRIQLVIISIIVFLSNLSLIFSGYLIGAATENVVSLIIKDAILYLLLYFGISLIVEVLSLILNERLNLIQIKISRLIGFDTYKKIMKLPAYAFEELSSGEIINRVTNDTETIVGSADQLIQIISRVLSSLIILGYIYYNSWLIGLEITSFLILYACFVKIFSNKLKTCNEKSREQNDKYTAIANESVRGIREIRTLGIVENLTKNVKNIITELLSISKKENKISTIYNVVSTFLKLILEVGAFITCAILLYQGKTNLTFFMALTYYIYRFTWLIESITEFSKVYESLNVAIKRINEVLGNILYKDVTYGDIELENIKGELEFKNVSFNYKNEPKIFNKFNISFEPNKKIAIVGSSGGGKTTIFNLLTRIFDPTSGAIYLDGVNIQELTEKNLRKHISIIRQEPFIFNRSIIDNFRLIDEKIELNTVRKYCKMALLDDYIMSLPNKYDTLLGEGGVNLSGGQKQRLAIARTLLKESKVILFDEATSALDNESQNYIKNSIDALAKDHTVIIVAHRLSTIIDADIIYVIKDGKVYAQGTHKYLIKNCEYYKNLYTTESEL